MNVSRPLVSVLISTYNRSALLRRAIDSVLSQDFDDFELVILDDCSSDNTPEVVHSYRDDRIRYIRNDTNMGSVHGDRAHIKRFVNELAQGDYFVYLCDDDYWATSTLLRRQVEAFQTHDSVSMVIGGQFHDTKNTGAMDKIDVAQLARVDYKDLYTTKLPDTDFFIQKLYTNFFMTSEEFLSEFSENPAARNLIVGATLYSKKFFEVSGAMSSNYGPKWQSGYELLMAPAACGDVIYFDEPAVIVNTLATNASFKGTQLQHYKDSILSIRTALRQPLRSKIPAFKKRFLKRVRRETIRNLTRTFLLNTLSVKKFGKLTLCDQENVKKPVKAFHALRAFITCGILPEVKDFKYFCLVQLPGWAIKKITL